jgi:acetylornithine deacetylase
VNAAEILSELVAISTPSSVSNVGLLDWVAEFVGRHGWRAEYLRYEDERGTAKANLIAWPGSLDLRKQLDLAFICHSDTVPYHADWSGALALEERDGYLHGCGSCDVKGSLACFLAAASEVKLEAVLPGVGLILTADEEVGCKGMERLLADAGFRIGSAIVSEPTSLRPGVAGKGYGLARITVEGREAHSAFPQQGVSAISVAARLIGTIEAAFADGLEASDPLFDPLFDPPRTTINIGVISGGTAKNILAGSCTFLVEWRPVPGEELGGVLASLQRLAEDAQRAEPRAAIRVEALRDERGFAPGPEGTLQSRLSSLLSSFPIGISFGSEASRVARIADEVIVIGPGDMRTAHSDRECVPISELDLWTQTLKELITTR